MIKECCCHNASALLIYVGCFYFEFSKSHNPRVSLSNRHENKQLVTCVHGSGGGGGVMVVL